MNSWIEVLGQWKQGIAYPRWAAMSHYAYGEARFLFYPPASWVLGAILGAVMPWKAAPGAYVCIALTLAGCSMFVLARRWLERRDAIFAAAFYAANPYHILIVYWRSAFAELLAAALLPLLLLLVLRLEEKGVRPVIWLAAVMGAVWLTNAPSAVMATYSLALLIITTSILRRAPRVLWRGAVTFALGLALAAFYVLPAAYEQRWVNITEVTSSGLRPRDNFLFAIVADSEHNIFNRLVSIVAISEVLALAACILGSWFWRKTRRDAFHLLLVWAVASALLPFSITVTLWDHLPQLRFVQLPWRWLLCMNVAVAIFVTLGLSRWWLRFVLCLAMLLVLGYGWHCIQAPWWEIAGDITEMRNDQQSGKGYEGVDEYVPAGADPYEIDRSAPQVAYEGAGLAKIQVQEWTAESRSFRADVNRPGRLVLRLFNYPAWQVTLNGKPVTAETRDVTGQMAIPVQAGLNDVQVVFGRTWDRRVGGIISLITLAVIAAGLALSRTREPTIAEVRSSS